MDRRLTRSLHDWVQTAPEDTRATIEISLEALDRSEPRCEASTVPGMANGVG